MDRSEILRYLGASFCSEELAEMIERAEREVAAASFPRHTAKEFSVQVKPDSVVFGETEIKSLDLAAHLQGCDSVFLFAFTLGPGVDTLIRRFSVTEPAMVPVLQACAAAYIEECVDAAQKSIEAEAIRRGLFLRPRYSPGYGDFSLEAQRFLFSALDITKRIGVALTESCLMTPLKSITAVIGISPDPSLCHIGKCMTCLEMNCPFRKV